MNWFYKFLDKILGSNTLYYPGCLTKVMIPEVEKNYEKLLEKIWIDFIKLEAQEYCCWSPVLRAGCKEDFEEIKRNNIEVLHQHAVSHIITNCPACYNMLKYVYKLPEQGIEVEHITQTLYRNQNKLSKNEIKENITYHDPCHLGRQSGVYDEPREVIENTWCKIKEMVNNKELSSCCGGWWWLINANPELSQKIAENTLNEVTSDKMVSPCPMCYYQFKTNAKNVQVVEFSELFLNNKDK